MIGPPDPITHRQEEFPARQDIDLRLPTKKSDAYRVRLVLNLIYSQTRSTQSRVIESEVVGRGAIPTRRYLESQAWIRTKRDGEENANTVNLRNPGASQADPTRN